MEYTRRGQDRIRALRYDRGALRRFLFFALPLLVLFMGFFHFAQEMLGLAPDPAQLAPSGGTPLPGWVALETWALEALALSSLFLLLQGRSSSNWLPGLLTGWIAWVFRGPLLVVTVVGLAGLPPRPWWSLTLSWWVLYSLCGLLLGGVAAAVGLAPQGEPASESRPVAADVPLRQPPHVIEHAPVDPVEDPVRPEPPVAGRE